jgi:hypothetical protein
MVATAVLAIGVLFAVSGSVDGRTNDPAPASIVTIDQARATFIAAGFQVDRTYNWTWGSPPVSTFQVGDPYSERVAMVLVYPTVGAAQLAHDHRGPLVVGYGAGVWRGNVAVVQTTRWELDRVQRMQTDCDNGVLADDAIRMALPATPPGVDVDFEHALDLNAFSL